MKEEEEENSIQLPLLLMAFDSCVHRKQAWTTLPQPATASLPTHSLEPNNMLALTLAAKPSMTFWPLGQ